MKVWNFTDKATGPKWWWISFMIAIAGLYLARHIYKSNLSFWLNKPDAQATIWSIVITLFCLGIFISMSARRAVEIGTSPKLLLTNLLIIPIPFWIVALGLLPTKNYTSPAPIGDFVRRLKLTAGLTTIFGTVALVGYVFLKIQQPAAAPDPLTETSKEVISETRLPSLSECYDNGIAYYKEIDSYPYLRSTGEYVPDVVEKRCVKSRLAFGYND